MSHFDQAAAGWDDDPQHVERAARVGDMIAARVPLQPDWRCLEFGCGTGLLSFRLRPLVGAIDLADTSAGMLAVVRDKIAAAGDDTMGTVDFEALRADPASGGSYALIYTLMTFHHVTDVAGCLAAFARLLKPGGYLCLVDLYREDGSFHGHLPEFAGHHGFDPAELAATAAPFGLRQESLETCYTVVKGGREYPLFLLVLRAG